MVITTVTAAQRLRDCVREGRFCRPRGAPVMLQSRLTKKGIGNLEMLGAVV